MIAALSPYGVWWARGEREPPASSTASTTRTGPNVSSSPRGPDGIVRHVGQDRRRQQTRPVELAAGHQPRTALHRVTERS